MPWHESMLRLVQVRGPVRPLRTRARDSTRRPLAIGKSRARIENPRRSVGGSRRDTLRSIGGWPESRGYNQATAPMHGSCGSARIARVAAPRVYAQRGLMLWTQKSSITRLRLAGAPPRTAREWRAAAVHSPAGLFG